MLVVLARSRHDGSSLSTKNLVLKACFCLSVLILALAGIAGSLYIITRAFMGERESTLSIYQEDIDVSKVSKFFNFLLFE